MQPESAALLWDVQNAASRIATFIDGLTPDSYAADELRRSAVERQLLIVGEALNQLRKVDQETAEQIPNLSRIIGLRNVLAHGYAVVDDTVVWLAASSRVPELLERVRILLASA
ncbi:HepT-like ribonuclease domain-containing protein [Plantibacter sp. YIM 135249]|jgi:uncharacterized protein with HEPN domain|uniref:HepT-like ribonuclease domain-containing protein n=1 Tax=Plantibacter sp. YIM 135249 TaxID=3423918 RepID=UPI003D32FBEE